MKSKVVVSLNSALISVSLLPWAAVTDFVNFPEKTNKFEQNYHTTFIDLPCGISQQDMKVVNFSIMCHLYLTRLPEKVALKTFRVLYTKHGAIDGYSRRILWLEASVTNNGPRVAWLVIFATVSNKLAVFRESFEETMAQKIAILREFKGLLGGTVTMLSQAIRALCMDDPFQIRELKAGGLFFAKRTLIDGYSFLKM